MFPQRQGMRRVRTAAHAGLARGALLLGSHRAALHRLGNQRSEALGDEVLASPRHLPTLCVRYTCLELEAELGQTARRHKIRALQKELRILFEQFARVRVARRDRERALQMEREVLAMCRPGVRQTPTGDPEPCGK